MTKWTVTKGTVTRTAVTRWSGSTWSSVSIVLAAGGLLLVLGRVQGVGGVVGIATAQETTEAAAGTTPCRPAAVAPSPDSPRIDCPAPPNTFDVSPFFSSDASADARALAGPTFDAWAWASFAAFNWPAEKGPDAETYPTGFRRGVPDLGSSFASAAADDVLVWETFKEKRELFQPTDTPAGHKVDGDSRWQDVTFDPGQEPQTWEGDEGIVPCSAAEGQRAARLYAERGHHRIFFQGRKHPTAGGVQALDEIVEVASQARESSEVLCAGYDATTTPSHQDCVTSLFPDDSPSEPRAIDGRTPVGPRVWKGDPKDPTARPVFFEVKVNYDFWHYILQRELQVDDVAQKAVASASILDHPKLPFRTSAPTGPGRSPDAVFGYDADAVVDAYGDLADPDVLPGIGSVQLKAGWLKLDPREVESGAFHTTEAIFFRSPEPEKDPSELCYEVDTFGLLALHIIQRVHSSTFDRRNPPLFAPGGTFVFATWEHTSLAAEPSGYTYANYFAFPGPLGVEGKFPFVTDVTPFPDYTRSADGAIPVEREMPYPLPSTAKVNRAVHDQLAEDSVWRNYRLIGTQFLPVGSEEESMAFNQPYYLANLVVETNLGLQKFQGLPPGVFDPPTPGGITPYYTQKVNLRGTSVAFERDFANVVFHRELRNPVNMGGCMGCHGVAQLKGYNFSFVFAAGQGGSDIDTQYHFAVAGGAPPTDDDGGR